MGPFKFIGKLLNSTAKSVDLMDNALTSALEIQELEHDTAYVEALDAFNKATSNEDFAELVANTNTRRAAIADLRTQIK